MISASLAQVVQVLSQNWRKCLRSIGKHSILIMRQAWFSDIFFYQQLLDVFFDLHIYIIYSYATKTVNQPLLAPTVKQFVLIEQYTYLVSEYSLFMNNLDYFRSNPIWSQNHEMCRRWCRRTNTSSDGEPKSHFIKLWTWFLEQ